MAERLDAWPSVAPIMGYEESEAIDMRPDVPPENRCASCGGWRKAKSKTGLCAECRYEAIGATSKTERVRILHAQGLDVAEIAEVLGVSPKNVVERLKKLKRERGPIQSIPKVRKR